MGRIKRTSRHIATGLSNGIIVWTLIGLAWGLTTILTHLQRPVILLDLPLFRLLEGLQVERFSVYRLYTPMPLDQLLFLFHCTLAHTIFGALVGLSGGLLDSIAAGRKKIEGRRERLRALHFSWNLFFILFLLLLDKWQVAAKGFIFPPIFPSSLALKIIASLVIASLAYPAARHLSSITFGKGEEGPSGIPTGKGTIYVLALCIALIILVGFAAFIAEHAAWSSIDEGNTSPPRTAGTSHKTGGDIILIIIDTLRADHLGCYGYKRPITPNIDALAGDGIRFATCISQAPWTIPSIMSIMTSMYPSVNGVKDVKSRLDPMRSTLAEAMKEGGYRTAGLVSHTFVDRRFGFADGFERYDDKGAIHKGAGVTTNLATSMIDDLRGDDFFFFVHYFDPHFPYDPPAPYDTLFTTAGREKKTITWKDMKQYAHINNPLPPRELERLIGLYDGEINYTDAMVGKFIGHLKKIGIYDRSTILLTADHGEEFKDHGSMGHTRTLYDELIHVPLIIKLPHSEKAGTVIRDQVRSLDIAPTLLHLAGADIPGEFQGVDLSPFWTKGDYHVCLPAHSETSRHAILRSIRAGNYKYIEVVRPSFYHTVKGKSPRIHETYDLGRDSEEKNDLEEDEAAPQASLRKSLFQWISSSEIEHEFLPKAGGTEEVTYDKETLERLKALGYVQ